MLPPILKAFGAFVDGRGYFDECEEVMLPKLKLKTDGYQGGGMDAPIDQDMGMEKLELGLTFGGYDADLAGLFGLHTANTQITLRGAYKRQGQAAQSIVIRARGGVNEQDLGSWKVGEKAPFKLNLSLNYYSQEVDGRERIFIDILNGIRRIDGVDQIADIRAAIGR